MKQLLERLRFVLTHLPEYLLMGLLKALSFIPFSLLYLLSDFLYWWAYRIFGYRKKVVFKNLRNSFPEKSEKEIQQIASDFYAHFCDLIVESFATPRMSVDDFFKRNAYKNLELVDRLYAEGRDLVIMTAHYGNWEWQIYMPCAVKHLALVVYQRIQNPLVNEFMLNARQHFGGVAIEMAKIHTDLPNYFSQKRPALLGLLSDQAPAQEARFRTTFLNQETAFYQGGEKISKKYNAAVLYLHIRKLKRGYYEAEFSMLCEYPNETKTFEITAKYAEILENKIKETPQYWLWSHNRWKHQLPPRTDTQNEPSDQT
jgi:Kdo2-lipid IVA lauroyltransferase/acyltransferase